jgi:thioredoxin 1
VENLVKEITDIEAIKNESTLCLVKFGAEWCAPCKRLDPVLEELSNEVNFSIMKVDVEKCPDIAQQFEVMSIPTMFVLHNGGIIGRKIGAYDKSEIVAWIEEIKAEQGLV